jgi:hypothetical protein
VNVRSSQGSEVLNYLLKVSKSFMEIEFPISISEPLLMALAAEAHLVEGQL